MKSELGSEGQNWAMDKRLSGGQEGKAKEAAKVQEAAQDPKVKEQGDLVRKLKSSKVHSELHEIFISFFSRLPRMK